MAASHIPNLKTLGSSRPPPLGRGRGRGRFGQGDGLATDGGPAAAEQDRIVQHTDQDASVSRVSAVDIGYLEDPYARHFVVDEPQRRFPIINRGTFVRTTAIDALVGKFLDGDPGKGKQIVSLGAGSDTRFFRLRAARPEVPLVYHELDFGTNTAQKILSIKRSQTLMAILEDNRSPSPVDDVTITKDSSALYSSTLNIHPVDLRSLSQEGDGRPSLPNVDPLLPTLLLSECCLIYLPPSNADAILKFFTGHLFSPTTPLGLVIYEPINPTDAFGRVMVQNLASRGIVLQTLKKYASLGRQKARLRAAGFGAGQGSADVDFIWEAWIAEAEKERIARLEMLDEVEEWRLLAQHYCVAWGWRDGEGEAGNVFARWSTDVRAQASDDDD
ncbi:MAG: hypothetical protein M1832_000457 [Thelocarpon impressellum]|nr:MAG: hypothetical protein M1832_000457 [Thelocarpon impressellum]